MKHLKMFSNSCIVLSVMGMMLICSQSVIGGEDAETEKLYKEWIQEQNIPMWVSNIFYEKKLEKKYKFCFDINPFYLRGDFNGDGKFDVVSLVKEGKTGKIGMVIFHYGGEIFVVGAGHSVGNGGDDYKWMTNWKVVRKQAIVKSSAVLLKKLLSEVIFVEKAESASAYIFWDGKKYDWYQLGD